MPSLTISIAFIASALALGLKPIQGLCVYLVATFAYSQRVTIEIATIDFTTGRIVILALLANAVFRAKLLRTFRWNWLDFWIVAEHVGTLLALTQTSSPSIYLVRQSGALFDLFLPYIAVRLVIRSRKDLLQLIRGLAWIGVPLALMGLFQCKTGVNPMGFLEQYYAWGMAGSYQPQMRSGFYRASVSMGVSIIFGLFFSAVAPMALGLFKEKIWSPAKLVVICLVLVGGAFSSMSSAPLFAIVMASCMLCAYPFRSYWPVFVIIVGVGALFVEVFSNRHFYHVLTLFAFDSSTAYYRIGLIEEAFGGGMNGHWLTGFGYVGIGPGNDNTNFHWYHQDLVNLYIGKLACYGLLGLTPLLISNVLYYRYLYKAARLVRNDSTSWLIWCFSAALVGWNVAMMTVSAIGQIGTLLSMFIGVAGVLPGLMERTTVVERSPSFRSVFAITVGTPAAQAHRVTACIGRAMR